MNFEKFTERMLIGVAVVLVLLIVGRVAEHFQIRDEKAAEVEAAAKRATMVQCQACGEWLSKRAKTCPHCGEPRE